MSAGTCPPSRIPLAPPSVKIGGHAIVESCAKGAVRQWKLRHFSSAEWTTAAKSINLMKHIPDAVQAVANNQRNWEPETANAEHGEHNHRSDFQSPRFLVPKIGGERQIKSRDRNEKQGKKDLLSFCRK